MRIEIKETLEVIGVGQGVLELREDSGAPRYLDGLTQEQDREAAPHLYQQVRVTTIVEQDSESSANEEAKSRRSQAEVSCAP